MDGKRNALKYWGEETKIYYRSKSDGWHFLWSTVPFSETDCRTAQLFAFHSQCRRQCQGLWVRTEPGWEVAEKTEPVKGDSCMYLKYSLTRRLIRLTDTLLSAQTITKTTSLSNTSWRPWFILKCETKHEFHNYITWLHIQDLLSW